MAKIVGITEIAKEVGLSTTTVSFVLNGKYRGFKIAPETAARVLEKAQELGYRSNYWAKSLASCETRLVGVMCPDISGSTAHEIVKGIQEVLDEHDYETLLAVYYWDRNKEQRELDMMLEKRVEALIALPHADSYEQYQQVLAGGCPVVFVSDYLMKVDQASSVALDPFDAIEKCMGHLHSLGHRKIALMTVQYESETLLDRAEAFKQQLARLNLPCDNNSIVQTELGSFLSMSASLRKLMSQPNRPTAVLTVSDALGLQILTELGKMKIRVPDELALASIGGLDFTDNPFFSLTTVDERRPEIGRRAAELVLRHLKAKKGQTVKPKHIRIKGPLTQRRSTLGTDAMEEDQGIIETIEGVLLK
ncbi:MAG: LacI family DNA-binding transcriptional regulator [Sedimentisphaerales bacterium]|nr:LacI family DNA-binding transcriptional regulator [Sedimentisphaerales bacterium]